MANTLGGVELRRLTVQDEEEGYVGGDIVRAVDGTPHVSYVRDLARWRLTCSYITYEEYLALLGVKESAKGGPVAFHLDEWESGIRHVIITGWRARRTPFFDNGIWHSSGRTVDIDLEEA